MKKKQNGKKQKTAENQKTATNNQWTNANAEAVRADQRERRDGPGGENV